MTFWGKTEKGKTPLRSSRGKRDGGGEYKAPSPHKSEGNGVDTRGGGGSRRRYEVCKNDGERVTIRCRGGKKGSDS